VLLFTVKNVLFSEVLCAFKKKYNSSQAPYIMDQATASGQAWKKQGTLE
jgi:hypothetical protein